jgi:hypothetical protein
MNRSVPVACGPNVDQRCVAWHRRPEKGTGISVQAIPPYGPRPGCRAVADSGIPGHD